MPNSSTAGTPSAWAAPASSTACEIDSRSTPGIASIGVRLSVPSCTNSGCTRCAGVSSVSRTMPRSRPVWRSRRMRVAGKAIATSLSGSQRPSGGEAYPQRVHHLAVSALGRDRPGIVERVTQGAAGPRGERRGLADDDPARPLHDDADRGAPPRRTDVDRLRSDLDAAGASSWSSTRSPSTRWRRSPRRPPSPPTWSRSTAPTTRASSTRAAAALAEAGCNITDLNTRLAGEAEGDLYVLLLEVAVPQGAAAALESALDAVGGRRAASRSACASSSRTRL